MTPSARRTCKCTSHHIALLHLPVPCWPINNCTSLHASTAKGERMQWVPKGHSQGINTCVANEKEDRGDGAEAGDRSKSAKIRGNSYRPFPGSTPVHILQRPRRTPAREAMKPRDPVGRTFHRAAEEPTTTVVTQKIPTSESAHPRRSADTTAAPGKEPRAGSNDPGGGAARRSVRSFEARLSGGSQHLRGTSVLGVDLDLGLGRGRSAGGVEEPFRPSRNASACRLARGFISPVKSESEIGCGVCTPSVTLQSLDRRALSEL